MASVNYLTPRVLWAQRKDRTLVSIQVEDSKDEQIAIDEQKLTFSCLCPKNNEYYKAELTFFDNIVPEESKQRKGGREFYFDLKKKNTDAPWWKSLLKEGKKNYVKVDFNRWKDEDDSDDEKSGAGGGMYGDQGLEDMMQKMGGEGGFDPGEMPESDDSDDDDIPDLVEEEKKWTLVEEEKNDISQQNRVSVKKVSAIGTTVQWTRIRHILSLKLRNKKKAEESADWWGDNLIDFNLIDKVVSFSKVIYCVWPRPGIRPPLLKRVWSSQFVSHARSQLECHAQ